MNIIKKINKIEVLENGVIQVRLQKILIEDNEVVEKLGFERYVLTPDTDIETITDQQIKNIANITWTPEVVEFYKQSLEEPL